MSSASPELVERLYRRLLDALAETSAVSPSALTIADLYQHLIPYRSVRVDLGVLELAQYEHALLRLLAGEGGMVRVLDDEARRELSAELKAPNPILGVYRDYAGVGVELRDAPLRRPAAAESRPAAPPSAPPAANAPGAGVAPTGQPAAATPQAPAPPGASRPVPPVPPTPPAAPRQPAQPRSELRPPPLIPPDAVRVERPAPRPPAEPAPPATPPQHLFAESDRVAASFPRPSHRERPAARATSPSRMGNCLACREPLPEVDGLRFCPNCGADQSSVPCDRCGAPVRRGWNFCIRCGARSAAGSGRS